MKFLKIFAVIMAVCLLGAAFVSCDARRWSDDTVVIETQASGVEVKLIIKDGNTTKYEGKVTCDGTLGNAIELFCAGEFDEEIQVFNDETDLLIAIGELKAGDGRYWKAYYEEQGQDKAFESIRTQTVRSGKTIVIVLD